MKSLDKKKTKELELVNKICKKVADRWAVEENMGGFDGIYSEFAKEVARKCLTQQRTEILEEILKHNQDEMTGLSYCWNFDFDGIALEVISLVKK